MENEKSVLRKSGDVVLFIVIMGLLLPFALIGALFVFLVGMPFLLPLVIVVYVSLGALLFMKIFGKNKHEKVIYRVFIGAAALSIVYAIPGIYDNTRPVVQDGNVETYTYEPFRVDTKAVTLNEPSTLKIEENLPIIDGATALYPIYSAFAQAVYPEKEYNLSDSEVMSNRTGEANENLVNGKADIIFVAAPSEDQLAIAKRLGNELKLTPIGKEAFVFFVNGKKSREKLDGG